VSQLEAFSETTLLQICVQTMTTKAKRETDSTEVYVTETAVLNMLHTGSNVTEEASLCDNQTLLNATSTYLNNFYFYRVSHLCISQPFNTYGSQSVKKYVSEHSNDRSFNQTIDQSIAKSRTYVSMLFGKKGTVTRPSCFCLPLVV
jgi:hypothetical protein